jgi:glutathione S-transferase
MMATVVGQLGNGPYMLGERFTAVDILWGTALAAA